MVSELKIVAPQQESTPEAIDRAGQGRGGAGALMVLAVVVSAGLVWFGTGLAPVPWLTWLAPVPLFALATRVSGRLAALAGFAAWAVGSLNMWAYYVGTLEVPAPIVVGFLLLQALAFTGVVVVFRLLARREWPVMAVLAAAGTWAGTEYLVSLFSPGGSFASIGYTQAEVLPVIQLTSATGVWGISFLLMAVPAIVVTAMVVRTGWRQLLVLGAVVVLGTAGYGVWRLQATGKGPSTTVAIATVKQSEDGLPVASAEARQVLDDYLGQVPAVAKAGATMMVLPEKVFRVSDVELAELGQRLSSAAAANRVTIVIGLTLKDSRGVHNIAMAYTGTSAVRYDKHHLVTGWEDQFTAGSQLAFLPGSTVGLAICKDLDHPSLVRAYAQQGTTMLLVPALDFQRDGWLHSRIAVVRGVEDGVTVVRAGAQGRLTVSEPSGRLVTDVATGTGITVTTVAVESGTGRTLYSQFGDWFAWACIALLAGALIRLGSQHRFVSGR